MRIASRFHVTVAAVVAGPLLVGAACALAARQQLLAERQARLHDQVGLALGILADEQARVSRGEIDLPAAQRQALDLIAAVGERVRTPLWVAGTGGRALSLARPPAGDARAAGLLAETQRFPDWQWTVGVAAELADIDRLAHRQALFAGAATLVMLLALAGVGWSPLAPLSLGRLRPAFAGATGGGLDASGLGASWAAAEDGAELTSEVGAAAFPAAEALRASEERVRLLLESAGEGIIGLDRQGRCIICNGAALRLLGYDRAEELLGRELHAMIHHSHPDGRPYPARECKARVVFEGISRVVDDEVFWRRDGTAVPVEYRMHPMLQNGAIVGAMVTFFDISERKRAEESLRLGSTVFHAATEAIIVCDARTRIKAVNPAFTRMTGYAAEEVLGRVPTFLDSGRHPVEFFNALWRQLRQDGYWQGEIWHRRKSGEVRADGVSLAAITDGNGRIVEYVGLLTDITARKRDEERIRWHATFDALTELPNRQSFLGVLVPALERAREKGRAAALLFLDLDRFKAVNDTHGHAVGDKLLQTVAKRLRHVVRETDTVGRLGGDEFTVLLEDLARPEDAGVVCQKLIESLSQPFSVDGHMATIGVSIGVAVFPQDAADPDDLLKRADQAMYRAKEGGRNNYRFYRAPRFDELLST